MYFVNKPTMINDDLFMLIQDKVSPTQKAAVLLAFVTRQGAHLEPGFKAFLLRVHEKLLDGRIREVNRDTHERIIAVDAVQCVFASKADVLKFYGMK